MPTDHRAALAEIKRFDQLIAYLRDEMGWPIARDSFEDVDDLFYDFTADELGIDPKTAAKITEIKRLKPLSTRQPWGIFFVKFEPKKLPVVALRRILSQVALKKRASANSADRTAWAADDLLFVSNYGEGSERQISFAHFSKPRDGNDLPTLKVLGWDNRDTALHLDAVAKELTQHLAWPDNDADVDAWRSGWRSAFTLRHGEVISTSKDLSIRLAALAIDIRDVIKSALAIETERGPLTKLLKAFQTSLVHDLDADGFADMYAQTIAYGLLSARIADPHKKTVDDFAGHMRTNPFLRELMETFLKVGGRRGKAGGPGIDFDELGVGDVVQLLDDANMEAVVRDFGDKNPQEDPVIHFYEHFLAAYDKRQKVSRGVFYTPRSVVSYIVRSVHELLQTEFGLEDGLADTSTWGEMASRHTDLKIPEGTSPEQAFVQILDPATGTGTFLVEVIDIIHKTMAAKWKTQGQGEKKIAALWNEYVPEHLLTRLHAYELLMAPYAIAHLKVGLKLYETGYRFGSEERARIYLTNALEPAQDFSGMFEFAIPALAHEAQAVNEIKRKQRFTVVIGNPPYSNFGQLNRVPFILDLLDDYKKGLGERKLNLDDDYIKFIRLGQWVIDQTQVGLLGYISANSYLSGAGHRKMRQLLIASFDKLSLLNLHGNLRKKEHTPDGDKDENVFDIMQGVAIGLMRKTPSKKLEGLVTYADLWGTRPQKYVALSSTPVSYEEIRPEAELFLLAPQTRAFREEYGRYAPLREIFCDVGQGIEMGRTVALASSKTEIESVISDLRTLTESTFSRKYDAPISSATWGIKRARQDVYSGRGRCMKLMVRPFDEGWTYYTGRAGGFHHRPRAASTANMLLNGNRALVAKRQSKEANFTSVWVVDKPINQGFFSIDPLGRESLFPVSRVRDASADEPGLWSDSETEAGNLQKDFLNSLPSSDSADRADVRAFEYIYAVLHSPIYRERYGEYLRTDFPRVPRPTSLGLYRALFGLGSEIIAVHLMESPILEHFITSYTGSRNPEVSRIGWSDDTVWLDAAATKLGQAATRGTIGFRGVPEAVWNFHVGGYQVCEKWLKDRKGRTLSKDDITHYQKIVVALSETIRLMKEIDEVIEQHGGWPGAFQTGGVVDATPSTPEAANIVEEYLAEEEPPAATEYAVERPALLEFAEPKPPAYGDSKAGAAPPNIEDIDREDLMGAIRQLFSDGQTRPREQAIKDLARAHGYQRVGPRIDETLDNALRTAVRRGILANGGDALSLLVRSITDYERDFLKEQFLASMQGRTYQVREDAIRQFARWLGFRRTGPVVDEIARSLINGLLREDRLETEYGLIRRKG